MEEVELTYRLNDGFGTELHLRCRSEQDDYKQDFLVSQRQQLDSKDELYHDWRWSLMGVPKDGLGISELADLFG
jgi:hypothetical protein